MRPEDIEVGEWYYVVQELADKVGYACLLCSGMQIDAHGMRPVFGHVEGRPFLVSPNCVHREQDDARNEIVARSLAMFTHPNAPKELPYDRP